jgi:hypothetical protein
MTAHDDSADFEARGRRSGACGAGRRRHRGRKERVLHTRISEQLAEDIRRMAEDLRVPVSNLVRNVLEEAFDVVDSVSDNVGDLVEEVVEEAERARDRIRARRRHGYVRRSRPFAAGAGENEAPEHPAYPEVIGWQPLIFNQGRRCSDCDAEIGVGERGFAGVAAGGLSPHALCGDCMEARR